MQMVKSVILLNTVEDKIVNLKIQNVNVEAAAAEREHQVTSLDSKTSEGSAKILRSSSTSLPELAKKTGQRKSSSSANSSK